jgi:D,D-heptose 1,7-bisphosphate phosphatase
VQVIFQSGGLGTRLYPETLNKPKCFLKINNKTIFSYQYLELKKYNLHKKLIIITNKKHKQYFINFFKKKNNKPKIISEEPIWGSGGSMIKNKKFFQKKFILIYSDIFFKINFKKFINSKKGKNKIICHKSNHVFDSDTIFFDKNNRITKIFSKKEKIKLSNISLSGIYFLNKNIFNKLRLEKIDMTSIIKKKIKNKIIYSYYSSEKFFDFGTKKRFAKLKKEKFDKRRQKLAFIIDRDGTMIDEKNYVNSIKKIKFLKDFLFFFKQLKKFNPLIICITNQSGISKGFITYKQIHKLHKFLNLKLQKKLKLNIDAFYICPHFPEKGFKAEIKKYKIKCSCRKPQNSLFKLANKNYNLNTANIYNIGNNISDMVPGIKTNIKNNILINRTLKNNVIINKDGYKEMNYFTLTNKFK